MFFLTQRIGEGTALTVLVSTSRYLREERLAIAVVVALLAGVAITSFIPGSRIKK
jgi:hypothetical protein